MDVPFAVQHLLAQEQALIQQAPEQALLPQRRIEIYAAFGPTYYSATYNERIAQIRAGHIPLTRADRVRAHLATHTAEYVLPLWFSALDEAQLLIPERIHEDLSYILREIVWLSGINQNQGPLSELLQQLPHPG